ncbi:MAG: hypothetical protein MJY87_04015 [Fibrobacter sp.]|nr:hypothetical protein [Fibrobacter sp.]
MKLLKFFAPAMTVASVAALLAACGDDSSNSGNSNNTSGNIPEYETAEDMVHCTKSHYGEFAYVADEDTYYECTSDGWSEIDAEDIDEQGKSSSSVSDDEKSSSSEKTDEKDTAAVEVQKVDSVTVMGVAEKGPYAKDGAVTIYGLDSAFGKTKNTFKGKISDDAGSFSIAGVTLENQYAIVEANGFFMNEMTGKKTSGTKTTLGALVDLSDKDTVKVNVNVLTELEKARALYLVQNEKYNVPAAKKRATKEILSALGVKSDSVSATELTLMGKDAETVGLYFASIALLGDLSPSKFNNRMEELSESFAVTGSISDTLQAEIADFLSQADSIDGFASIMKNVKAVNEKVPAFDKMLYTYWVENYGLPDCTSEKEESIEKNANKLSASYKAGFACTSNRWHKSTALDTELGLCVAKTEGAYKKSESEKFYTCKDGVWREITSTQYELKECSEARNGEYKSVDENFFLCKDKQWIELNAVEFELKDCNVENQYSVVKTEADGNSYVCVEASWREATDVEAEFGYCSKADSTKFNKFESDGKYYVCLKDGWTAVDDTVGHLGFCTDKNQRTVAQNLESKDYYMCVDGSWRGASDVEAEFGYCATADSTKFNQLKSDGKYYVCLDKGWTAVSDTIGHIGFCTDKNKQTVVRDLVSKTYYVCEGGKWRGASSVESEHGYCSNPDSTVFKKETSSGSYYVCLNSGWTKVSNLVGLFGFCTKNRTGDRGIDPDSRVTYICENEAWRKASSPEKEFGLCGTEEQYVESEDGYYYRCASNQWNSIDSATYYLEKVCSADVNLGERASVTLRYGGDRVALYFRCSVDGFKRAYWGVISSYEYANGVCGVDDVGYTVTKDGSGFCSRDGNILNDVENRRDWEMCTPEINRRFVWDGGQPYMCMGSSNTYGKYTYSTMKDSRDGKTYNTIVIGNQVWLAEDLDYDYNKGTAKNYKLNSSRMYKWSAAMDSAGVFSTKSKGCGDGKTCTAGSSSSSTVQGVCPSGWHLPNRNDWNTLFSAVGGTSSAGEMLRSTSCWNSSVGSVTICYHGKDYYGFHAEPVGYYDNDKNDFYGMQKNVGYWTSEESTSNAAYYTRLNTRSDVSISTDSKSLYSYPVRCVKD